MTACESCGADDCGPAFDCDICGEHTPACMGADDEMPWSCDDCAEAVMGNPRTRKALEIARARAN